MVICRFFLQGACRFGTKCNNEHLDIKQLVKSDLEAAINGKQWPLSCFGPFKDKPCIPSFIEDQSFEEIRWLCYEAKQKNCLNQYVQHFNKEAVEANTKMKTLLQLPPQIVDIICRLYDVQTDTAPNVGLLKNNSNNPFGLGNHATNETSTLFGKPGTAAGFVGGFNNVSTSNTGNVFGSLTTSPAGGIFGGGNMALNQNSQTSIFSQQTPKTNSIFGGGNSQNGLFGQTQTNAGTMGNLFGQTPQPSVGLFSQQTHQQSTGSGSIFGQQAQHPQTTQTGGLFTQNQVQGGGSIFNQNPPNSGNLFSQSVQPQQTQNSTSFPIYQANKQQAASVFGQHGAFAQQNQNGIFGQMATTAPAANNTNNMFGQPLATTNASGIFNNTNPTSVPAQNIFAQALQQQAVGSTMQPSAGLFQQGSLTQGINQQQSPFGQQMVGNNASQPLLQSPIVSSTVYSKLEDLSPEDLEAFKADVFTPGRIPSVPPPQELIN